MIDLYFPSHDEASLAVTTPEAGAFTQALFQLATGGVRILMSEVEVAQG
jgi:hypothetical protein